MNIINTRESSGYKEDFAGIDPYYPTSDELDNMDNFLTHYRAFVDRVDGHLSGSGTIALYGVYMSTTRD